MEHWTERQQRRLKKERLLRRRERIEFVLFFTVALALAAVGGFVLYYALFEVNPHLFLSG